MTQQDLFHHVSLKCSRITTSSYSTSFSIGIRCLDKDLRDPIYSIYGFVRFADEIVDTFHAHNKRELFDRFKNDTFRAIENRIDLNPIINSFQETVNKYAIDHALIRQFLHSMELDLEKTTYDHAGFEEYVLGSAEVVGLMCLQVFCRGDQPQYQQLKPLAMKLGSAFQKINFLRDLKDDYVGLGRMYFPGINLEHFDNDTKRNIEISIAADFKAGYAGIKQLPRSSRLGVYVAYLYYLALFEKIRKTPSSYIMKCRIRIENTQKLFILCYSFIRHQLNLI